MDGMEFFFEDDDSGLDAGSILWGEVAAVESVVPSIHGARTGHGDWILPNAIVEEWRPERTEEDSTRK